MKAQTRASTDASDPVTRSSDGLGRTEASQEWRVLVADPRTLRLEAVSLTIAGCGGIPQPFAEVGRLHGLRATAHCSLAIVALQCMPRPDHPAVEAIRALKQNGFKVIAYEDGLGKWPVTIRCLPLLAGATQLFDSQDSGFAGELHRYVSRHCRLEADRNAEEHQVNELMRTLGVVGESQVMRELFRSVLRISVLSDLPALLTGETGTGKECLARAIHQLDPKRRTGPFIALNCGALTPTLAESELFGHRRGAFTGADRERKGLIRAANGGVLFLDEIAELTEPLQAKLLRVLQENRVLPVGEEHEVPVNVRVVAATNRDLAEMVCQGKFRADLMHRLNVLPLHIPPLRERREDIRPLLKHFTKVYSTPADAPPDLTDEVVEALEQLKLPGNVRQLENIVRRVLVDHSSPGVLRLSNLPPEVWHEITADAGKRISAPCSGAAGGTLDDFEAETRQQFHRLIDLTDGRLDRSLDVCERILISIAMERSRGNQTETARLLHITSRSVYNKLRRHQLAMAEPLKA